MITRLTTYGLAVDFHRAGKMLAQPTYLRDQWVRASSSIVLNIAEGYGKESARDQARFYSIALGSLRECQAILDLIDGDNERLKEMADRLGGSLYKLGRSRR